ncbi:hypothetical protein C8R46DRAFT_1036621 [Mycena filopes]|nr:hypothetical protein C8R46DRAFT_1036621 [Mycena filopes]
MHLLEQRIALQVINITFAPTTTNLPAYFEILVNDSVKWGEEGHLNNVPPGITYIKSQISLANATTSMAAVAAFAAANNRSASVETFDSWFDFSTHFVAVAAGRAQLVALLVKQTAQHGMSNIPVVAPIFFKETPGATSVTPAWRDSLWHGGPITAITAPQHTTLLAPDSVSYWGSNYPRPFAIKKK